MAVQTDPLVKDRMLASGSLCRVCNTVLFTRNWYHTALMLPFPDRMDLTMKCPHPPNTSEGPHTKPSLPCLSSLLIPCEATVCRILVTSGTTVLLCCGPVSATSFAD